MNEPVHNWVQSHQSMIFDCLRSIVSIETQNLAPLGNEQKGQMAVAGLLSSLGCEVDIYEISSVPGLLEHPKYWTERPCTGRPNVMGIRRGSGGGRSLIFSSHMDTVPVGVDPWSKPPWGGEISEGKFWGLGSYDMKAGLVASILTVKALNDLGITLQGDLMIESVVDEEFGGCNGTLAARLKYNADLAVVPEPTNMIVCPAHHGGLMLRVIFRGKPGWGFSPEKAVDPTSAIARFITLLNEWAAYRHATVTVPEIYKNNHGIPVLINQLKAGEVNANFFADRVPSNAWLTVWVETYPGMTQDSVVSDLKDFYRAAQTKDSVLAEFEPEWKPIRWLDGSEIAADHEGVSTFAEAVAAVQGKPATIQGAPFACDGHIFNLYSPTPMVLLGPTGGGPHSPDEFIYVDDYLRLIEIFIHGAMNWCGVKN